jgi:hypothetical protein
MAAERGSDRSFGVGGNGDAQGAAGGFLSSGEHGTAPDVGRASPTAQQAGERASEGRPPPPSRRGTFVVKPDRATRWVGQSINQQGNMLALKKNEPGRIWRRTRDSGRPVGYSSARFSTGVNPEDPINDSPYWPRP